MERKADSKSEFLDGIVYAMAGASARHNLIVANVVRELGNQFKGRPCVVYPSDLRLKVSPTGLYTYPDVSALCGKALFEDEAQDTLLNPELVVEVLSPSTDGYDHGAKFGHYRKVTSIRNYVLIAQDCVRVEHYARQGLSRWVLQEHFSLEDVLDLSELSAELRLSDIYDKVSW